MPNTTTLSLRFLSSTAPLGRLLLGALMIPAAVAVTSVDASEAREPKQVYDQVCGHCHSQDKAVGPEITMAVPEGSREGRAAFIRTMVRHGNAAMPAFRSSEVSDPELKALAEALASGELAGNNDGE